MIDQHKLNLFFTNLSDMVEEKEPTRFLPPPREMFKLEKQPSKIISFHTAKIATTAQTMTGEKTEKDAPTTPAATRHIPEAHLTPTPTPAVAEVGKQRTGRRQVRRLRVHRADTERVRFFWVFLTLATWGMLNLVTLLLL